MKAAFGRVNLTPDDYIGRNLAGYTPMPKCSGKYDDIYASVFLFEEKGKILALITADFLKLPIAFTRYIKTKINERFQIPSENILIHATHTHKSFDQGGEFSFGGGYLGFVRGWMFGYYNADDKYNVWMTRKILSLIKEMKDELKECRIAWKKKKIEDPLIINRRHPTRKSTADLGIINIQHKNSDENIGLIVTYAAHPTTLNETVDKLSADYPGQLIKYLDQLSGNTIKAAYFNSPCGDINPITTCGTEFDTLSGEKNNQFDENSIYGQKGTFKHTQQLGKALAKSTYELIQSLQEDDYIDKPNFFAYERKFVIPMRDFTKYSSKVKIGNRLNFMLKKGFLMRIPAILTESKKPNFPGFSFRKINGKIGADTMVQYITIGTKERQLSISGIPGELFEDIAEEIYKNSTERENTFIFQNSNDWIGYLFPLNEYITEGGYETFITFSPLAGEYVRRNYYKLLEEVKQA